MHTTAPKTGLLTLPPANIELLQEDLELVIRPSFDGLARAGGMPGSPRYRRRRFFHGSSGSATNAATTSRWPLRSLFGQFLDTE